MTNKILITLIYILPISGASYTLFKYSYRYSIVRNQNPNDKALSKSAMIKMTISFLAGIAGAILGTLWLIMVWLPSVQLSLYMKILFGILLIPFGVCLAALGGLSKAVESGAGAATCVLNELKNIDSKKPN